MPNMNQDYSQHYSEHNLKSKLKNVVHRVGHKAVTVLKCLVISLSGIIVASLHWLSQKDKK